MFIKHFLYLFILLALPFIAHAAIRVKNYNETYAVMWDDTKWACSVVGNGAIGECCFGKAVLGQSTLHTVKFWVFSATPAMSNLLTYFPKMLSEIGRGANYIFSNLETLEKEVDAKSKETFSILYRSCYFSDSGEGVFLVHLNMHNRPYWTVMQFEDENFDQTTEQNLLKEARIMIIPIVPQFE